MCYPWSANGVTGLEGSLLGPFECATNRVPVAQQEGAMVHNGAGKWGMRAHAPLPWLEQHRQGAHARGAAVWVPLWQGG